jgi:hypothetical protein
VVLDKDDYGSTHRVSRMKDALDHAIVAPVPQITGGADLRRDQQGVSMRNARKLFLLAVTALAALAFSATSASAQVEVESTVEEGHCSVVTINEETGLPEGGCQAHVVNSSATIDLLRHTSVGEAVSTACQNEYDLAIGEDGEGYLFNQNISTGTGCGTAVAACVTGGVQEPWHVQIEEDGPGSEEAHVEICLDVIINPVPLISCRVRADLDLDISGIADHHAFETQNENEESLATVESVVAANPTFQPQCDGTFAPASGNTLEIRGHFVTEEPDGFEIHHP